MVGYGLRPSSLVNIACQIQSSGQCTPDFILEHSDIPVVRSLLRSASFDYAFLTCEHMRYWLFDDLPSNREIGARYSSAEAGLLEYLGRVHAQSWYTAIVNKW